MASTLLPAAEIAAMALSAQAALPESCTIVRGGPLPYGTAVAQSVPCRATAQTKEEYPFNALPNQPVSRWHVIFPAGTDVQSDDLLVMDSDGRIFAAIDTSSGASWDLGRTAECILSATGGLLGDAYLRANAWVRGTRPSGAGGLYEGYAQRHVHLAYAQANPAAPLERLTGGVATLQVSLFDLVDADWKQGDGVEILSQDGASALPGVYRFKLGGVLRRPLPFAILEADLIATV